MNNEIYNLSNLSFPEILSKDDFKTLVDACSDKKKALMKSTNEITAYFNTMKECKEGLGETEYRSILNDYNMENAASAKSKKDQSRILSALKAALNVKNRSEEKQSVEGERMIPCPNTGNPNDPKTWDEMRESYCNESCKSRDGCPSWE